MEITPYVMTGVAALSMTTLRGFQNKAVAGNMKQTAYVVGAAMYACELATMASVIRMDSAAVATVAACSAGAGWVLGMVIHDVVSRKKREREEKEAKAALKKTVDKRIAKRLNAVLEETEGDEDDPLVPVTVHWQDGPRTYHLRESLYNAIKQETAKAATKEAEAQARHERAPKTLQGLLNRCFHHEILYDGFAAPDKAGLRYHGSLSKVEFYNTRCDGLYDLKQIPAYLGAGRYRVMADGGRCAVLTLFADALQPLTPEHLHMETQAHGLAAA